MTAYALLILAALAMAISHACAKRALANLPLGAFLFARAAASLLCAVPFAVAADWPDLEPGGWALVAAAVLLSPVLVNVLFFAALRGGSVATTNALMKASPMFILPLQWAVLGRGASPAGIAGAALIVVGCGLLAIRAGAGSRTTLALGIAAALVHALALVLQARVLELIDLSALIVLQSIAFAALAGAMHVVERRRSPRPVAEPSRVRPFALAAASGLLMLVVFDWFKFLALPQTGPFVAGCLLLLSVPFSAILGRVALHERLPRPALTGVTAIFLGSLCAAF